MHAGKKRADDYNGCDHAHPLPEPRIENAAEKKLLCKGGDHAPDQKKEDGIRHLLSPDEESQGVPVEKCPGGCVSQDGHCPERSGDSRPDGDLSRYRSG